MSFKLLINTLENDLLDAGTLPRPFAKEHQISVESYSLIRGVKPALRAKFVGVWEDFRIHRDEVGCF
jgi:hypothetical protein